jgi:ADP-ribosyl-[dinitrogen reductase] hydrolase
MTRTSETHPLQIAEVFADGVPGRIGITFCPGKKHSDGFTGAWHRDLCLDLDAIRDWGAAALVSLVEDHELSALGVEDLGAEAARRHMEWVHLPIPDVSVPPASFEQRWIDAGESLRARLRDGFSIVVHCKGGLGRAGTIAARLLVELGTDVDDAVAMIRKVRPGAIETAGQLEHVRSRNVVAEANPSRSAEALRDRGIGALLGLAVGDALGTTIEFRSRDSYEPLADIIGGGPFGLQAGEWTDDTAMALALADSLLATEDFDEADLMRRFVLWQEQGSYSCTGDCFDIGVTVAEALKQWKRSGDPIAGSTDPMSAGNGSLMRLAPVALRFWNDREMLARIAARQSATTHGAPEAVSACVAYANVISDAIEGCPRNEVLRTRDEKYAGRVKSILRGSWRGARREDIGSTGYVAHSLEAALWSVGRTGNFRDAVLTAANLGGDADTTAAIAGQLAGALYGASGIPDEWLERLAWRSRIENMAIHLLERSVVARLPASGSVSAA